MFYTIHDNVEDFHRNRGSNMARPLRARLPFPFLEFRTMLPDSKTMLFSLKSLMAAIKSLLDADADVLFVAKKAHRPASALLINHLTK